MQKSGLKTSGHHVIFSFLDINRSNMIVFVYILGFIFYGVSHVKTDLHNDCMN